MAEDPRPLLAWSLAGFHVALLVSLVVLGGYRTGAAADLLAGLDTAVGMALYGYLWVVTWWTNRRWIETVGLDTTARPNHRDVLAGALLWGGATGLLIVVGPGVITATIAVADGGLAAVPIVGLLVGIAVLLAVAVGAVLGVAFATLDLGLLRASRALLPADWERTDTDSRPASVE